MIHVVIGVQSRVRISTGESEHLVGRRSGHAYHECWEFPGGKVEPGETLEKALIREWREELGEDVDVVGPFVFQSTFTTVDDVEFLATAFRVVPRHDSQVRTLVAHGFLEWKTQGEIESLADDVCTPSLKPITAHADSQHRAERCFLLAMQRLGVPRNTSERARIEAEATRLMGVGILEALDVPDCDCEDFVG